jgi:hypothetical protein
VLKKVLEFFIFSKVYVALCVAFLANTSFKIFGVPANWVVLGFIFFSTLALYAFHQVWGLNSMNTNLLSVRQKWSLANKWSLMWITIIAGIISVTMGFQIPFKTLILLIPCGLISIGYSTSIFFNRRLRDVPLIKIYLISIVVSAIVVVLPGIVAEVSCRKVFLLFSIQSLFLLGITIPFDVRDVKIDNLGLKTIPLIIGERKAIQLAVALLFVSGALAWCLLPNGNTFLISSLLSSAAVWFTNSSRNEYFFSLAIEGMMIVQFVLIYLLQ